MLTRAEPVGPAGGRRGRRSLGNGTSRSGSRSTVAVTAVLVLIPATGGNVRTAINSAARLQQMSGVLARGGRHGCRPTAAAFDAAQPLVSHGAGPARCRVRIRSRRAGL